MSQDNNRDYEHELKALESQVDELITLCSQLKSENQSLRDQQMSLTTERAKLLEKNELARSRVESMIMRLKSMEQEYDQ